jgi:hypothetical protein
MWTRYQGCNNHTLWIFSAYQPKPLAGPFMVASQHREYFLTQQDYRCPRKAFLEDSAVDISSAFQDGDHVVVLIDGNTDMRKSDLSICFTSLHLREIILERHGMKGPKTCKKADLEPYRWHKGFSWYYYAGWWIFWL